MASSFKFIALLGLLFLTSCNEKINPTDETCITENFFSEYASRNFEMGFSTWSFGPNAQDVDDTYQFITDNADMYSEHIDFKIPWNAWINDLPLPTEFTTEIEGRVARKITNNQLVVSVSLLNMDRSDLAEDFDGSIPNYLHLNDVEIEDAYYKHLNYIIQEFNPNYFVIALEVNELKIHSETKWQEYKLLMANVKLKIRQAYPTLKISESITLHNLYQPEIDNPNEYINETVSYMNQMDFVAISFYPFFKGQHARADFQLAFDLLHEKITKPIAFVETSHLAEDLTATEFDLFIESDACEQNAYLETLFTNAQTQNYAFVIWWAHKDYDALWATFPEEQKGLGKLWRDTGLLDENGNERIAHTTWQSVLEK